MDGKVRNLQDGLFALPISRGELSSTIINNDLSSKSQITVEPGMPQTTTIELNSQLLEACAVASLRYWSEL
jgi:hypothetical protein